MCSSLSFCYTLGPETYEPRKQVLCTLGLGAGRTGFKAVQKLKADLPPVLLRWVRDFHNSFHNGAGVSFLELMKCVTDADASWNAYATDKGIGARDSAAETKCFAWLKDKYPMKFASMSQFKAARAMANRLAEFRWKDDVEQVVGEICDFRHKKLNSVGVLLNMNTLFHICSKYFGPNGCVDDRDLKTFALEAMKFVVLLCSTRLVHSCDWHS